MKYKIKTIIALIAVLLLSVTAVFICACVENYDPSTVVTPSEGLEYILSEDGAAYEVAGMGMCKDTQIVIASEHNGLPVTAIKAIAFGDCTDLTCITIPDCVTQIGENAFAGCTAEIKWGNKPAITSIGAYAFAYYKGASITIPDGVTYIGESAFGDCESLTGIAIPDGVTQIGENAFLGCKSLISVALGESSKLKSIGGFAFAWCRNLTEIAIPAGVTSIGDGAFGGCPSLESLTVSKENSVYKSSNNCLIKRSNKTLTAGCKSSIIPSDGTVTSIGNYAFFGCESLAAISIPDRITSIGDYAFHCCEGLTTLTFGKGISYIGGWAFYGCTGLEGLTIPEGLTSISHASFADCTALKSINIPNGIFSIGAWAFYNCQSLKSVTLQKGVASIGERAFYNCTSLEGITLPDSVTSIGNLAFMDCTALERVDWNAVNCTSAGSSDLQIFSGCTGLTEVVFAENVQTVPAYAFDGCTNLTGIAIPDGVTSIGVYAFENTAYLNESANWEGDVLYIGRHLIRAKPTISGDYTVKQGIKTIAGGAFSGCPALTGIRISDGTLSIGELAFGGCTGLEKILIPDSVTSIGSHAFYETAYYGNKGNWDGEVLYIGTALIEAKTTLTGRYDIKQNTRIIADAAFKGCGSLNSLIIPDSVAYIGLAAFDDCTGIECVYYGGTYEMWNTIIIHEVFNDSMTNATRYYYSEDNPFSEGNYWHYGEDGQPAIW